MNQFMPSAPVRQLTTTPPVRAPKGGIELSGEFFPGGQAIPSAFLAQADEAQLLYLATGRPQWSVYIGPKGGRGWKSTRTGRVLYQQNMPGEHEHEGGSHPEPGTAPAKQEKDSAKPDKPQSPPPLTPEQAQRVASYPQPAGGQIQWDSPETQAKARELFGREVEPRLLHALGSGVEGATLKAAWEHDGLGVATEAEGMKTHRRFKRDEAGKLLACNFNMDVEKTSPWKGAGLDIFTRQVEGLRLLGFDRIEATASGSFGDEHYIGYYVWPRYGYEGAMDEWQFAKLPEELREQLGGKRDVRDLFDLPGGGEAWRLHGSTIGVTFRLGDDSRSMKALRAYIEERSRRDKS